MVKVDPNGNTLWEKSHGGSDFDEAEDIEETTPDRGFILTGRSRSYGVCGMDVYLPKLNSLGDSVWVRLHAFTVGDHGYGVEQIEDGSHIVCGTVARPEGDYDLFLLKADTDGDSIWTRVYGGSGDEIATDVKQVWGGGYILAAEISDVLFGAGDAYAMRTDDAEDSLWTSRLGGPYSDSYNSVAFTADGEYVFAGLTTSGPSLAERDFYVVKLEHDGTVAWETVYGGTDQDVGRCLEQMSDGAYVIGGYSTSFSPGSGYLEALVVGTKLEGASVGRQPESAGDFLLETPPNPFRGPVSIGFEVRMREEVEVAVYNVAGRLVKKIAAGPLCPGSHLLEWDGKDITGLDMSPGVYFCRLRVGNREIANKVVLAR